eukprot:6065144-Pleurochrysis_carterae.AAC.1
MRVGRAGGYKSPARPFSFPTWRSLRDTSLLAVCARAAAVTCAIGVACITVVFGARTRACVPARSSTSSRSPAPPSVRRLVIARAACCEDSTATRAQMRVRECARPC